MDESLWPENTMINIPLWLLAKSAYYEWQCERLESHETWETLSDEDKESWLWQAQDLFKEYVEGLNNNE